MMQGTALVVKHCLSGGAEMVYPLPRGGRVEFIPAHQKRPTSPPEPEHPEEARRRALRQKCDSLFIDHDTGDRIELLGGRAYVMNEAGGTVATYWLGGQLEDPPETTR